MNTEKTHKAHIIVTERGWELQGQLLTQDILLSPTRQSPNNNSSPIQLSNKTLQLSSRSSILPTHLYPCRPGYFGPNTSSIKEASDKKLSPSSSPIRDHILYPNYLKRDPKEYPAKHLCSWKPKSTIVNSERMTEEVPHGKYVHHTLFTEINLHEPPRISQLNKAVFGKEFPLPINLSPVEQKNWKEILGKKNLEEPQKYHLQQGKQANSINSVSFDNSSAFNRSSNTYLGDDVVRNSKVAGIHLERENRYQKLLFKFDEKAKMKYKEKQEAEHIPPNFEIDALSEYDNGKLNENIRYSMRLKNYHNKKFETTWKVHEEFLDKLCQLPAIKQPTKKHQMFQSVTLERNNKEIQENEDLASFEAQSNLNETTATQNVKKAETKRKNIRNLDLL